jgi:peptidoglycan/LPS O-acetylase OafA/YrhL
VKKYLINSLTSFRFFAAFMVLMWHLGYQTIQFGYIGVSFFFILSGFILTYNYSSKFTNLTKKQIKKFYIARFAKIYPVHILTFLLSLPLAIQITDNIKLIIIQLGVAFFNIFLIQTYIPIQWLNISYNGVSWSLSNELFFYVFFPFLSFMILKLTHKNSRIILLLCFLYGLYSIFIVGVSFHRVVPLDDWLLYLFPVVRIFDFTIGICLGTLFLYYKDSNSKIKKNKGIFTFMEFYC